MTAYLKGELKASGNALIASAAEFIAKGLLAPDGQGNLVMAGS